MVQTELNYAGWIMILGGSLLSLLGFLSSGLEIHILLSPDYGDLDQFGPGGVAIIRAFTVHIGSLVIALGVITLAIARWYVPGMRGYLIAAATSWYILDSVSSLLFGYGYNLLPNTVFLISFLFVLRKLPSEVDLNTEFAGNRKLPDTHQLKAKDRN